MVSRVTRWLLPLQHGRGDVICSATVRPPPRHPSALRDKHGHGHQTSMTSCVCVLTVGQVFTRRSDSHVRLSVHHKASHRLSFWAVRSRLAHCEHDKDTTLPFPGSNVCSFGCGTTLVWKSTTGFMSTKLRGQKANRALAPLQKGSYWH